jgi:ComF family protein
MPIKKGGIANYAVLTRNFLLDLFFPIECLGCAKPDEWICSKCFRALPINNRLFCPGCGRDNNNSAYCDKCAPNYFLDGIWTASDYNNPIVANIIKKYKYHFIKELGTVLTRLLIIYFTQLLESCRLQLKPSENWEKNINKRLQVPLPVLWPENTAIIPIPLHKKRRRWRGFNQAEQIAAGFCRHFKFNFEPNLLIRVRHTAPQMKLNKKKRWKNLANAFKFKGDILKSQSVILIDDVATSGATLNECARVLKQNGASEVWGLVVAHG